jgi:hypothetical protein
MDESVFRRTRDAMTPRPCAFEKAMLAGACACSLAERRNIAEREAVDCSSAAAGTECAALRSLLRQKSAFALGLTQVAGPLPHAKEMKVECGGLQGVQLAASPSATPPASVVDVHRLLQSCSEKFGGLANLPYSAIIQSVVAYQIRRRQPDK